MTAVESAAITPALRIDNLSVGYGEGLVVRNVTADVPAGSVVAILGPNGAGKTTLLRSVTGFLKPAEGSVTMFGTDVTRAKPHRRFANGVCLIPEGRGIFRNLTVRQNLVIQAERGTEHRCIDRAIEAFPVLGARLHQRAGTLSGGEQQMLAVSATFARDPRLVLLDEVSFGLAPLVVDQIFEFLAQLVTTGTSLVIVDQYAKRALELADHAYLLRRGEIAFAGAADELLDSEMFTRYLDAGATTDGPSR